MSGIIVNTLIAAVSGGASGMLISRLRYGHVNPTLLINGLLAGLVGVTAGAHAYGVLDAAMIGAGSCLCMVVADHLLRRFRIDDAVSAVPVHLAAGVWGTLAVALFGDPQRLDTGLGRLDQFIVQLQGVLACGVWAFGIRYVLLRIVNRICPFRVSAEAERVGLNVSEHGARTELIDLLGAMETHQCQGQFAREVAVEPFTEVGLIAEQYNKVIRALQSAVAKTHSIVRDIREGIVTCSREGILTSCNPGAERLFGLPAKQLVGQPLQRFIEGDDWGERLRYARGGQLKWEVQVRRGNGVAFPVELTASQAGDGEDCFVCMVRDITERRRVEEQLFAEKRLAQITLSSIEDGVISTDENGRIRFLNPSAEQLTGWTQALAQGMSLGEVYRLFDEAGAPLPPANPRRLRRRSDIRRAHRAPVLLRRRDGSQIAVQDALAPIRDSDEEVIGLVLTFRDVTAHLELSRELTYQANHDTLTGLLNRSAFERQLERLLAERPEDEEHMLCYIDLDQFKVVNDTCGHAAGDELLRQLAQLLRMHVRGTDSLARLGGDEFGILFCKCSLLEASLIAEGIRRAVDEFRFNWAGKSFAIGASIGLVEIDPQQGLGLLLSAADSACYAAKDGGRNRVHIYQADDQQLLARHGEMQWSQRLRQALDSDRLRLYVQPIRPLGKADGIPHYEMLVRMLGEDGSIIPPGHSCRRRSATIWPRHWIAGWSAISWPGWGIAAAGSRTGLSATPSACPVPRWATRNCLSSSSRPSSVTAFQLTASALKSPKRRLSPISVAP